MSIIIEDIYNQIRTDIETLLPTYRRLPNPYFPDLNTYLQMQQGYGIKVDAGRNTQRYVGCLMTWERLFTIILMNQITTTENNIDAREMIEKNILVDHDKIVQWFEKNSTLSGLGIKAYIADDSGLQPIGSETGRFLQIDLSLYVEYQEAIT